MIGFGGGLKNWRSVSDAWLSYSRFPAGNFIQFQLLFNCISKVPNFSGLLLDKKIKFCTVKAVYPRPFQFFQTPKSSSFQKPMYCVYKKMYFELRCCSKNQGALEHMQHLVKSSSWNGHIAAFQAKLLPVSLIVFWWWDKLHWALDWKGNGLLSQWKSEYWIHISTSAV